MKFRHYLETISGVEIYPLISLIVFFLFFLFLFYFIYKADKPFLNYMAALPVDQDSSQKSNDDNL